MAEKPLKIVLYAPQATKNVNDSNLIGIGDLEELAAGIGDSALQEKAEKLHEIVNSARRPEQSEAGFALALKSAWSEHYGPDVSLWPESLRDALETINAGVGFANFDQNLSSAFQNLRLYEETVAAFEVAQAVVAPFMGPDSPMNRATTNSFIPSSAARAGLSFISSPFTLIAPIWMGGIVGRAVTGLTANAGRALALADEAIAGLAAAFGLIGESTAFVGASRVISNFARPELIVSLSNDEGREMNENMLSEIASSTIFFGMLRFLGSGTNFVASLLPATQNGIAATKLIGHAGSIASLAATEELQPAVVAPFMGPASPMNRATTFYAKLWRAAFLHGTIQAVNGTINLSGVKNRSSETLEKAQEFIDALRVIGISPELVAEGFSPEGMRFAANDSGRGIKGKETAPQTTELPRPDPKVTRELSFEGRKLPLLSEGKKELWFGFPDDPYVVIVEKKHTFPRKASWNETALTFRNYLLSERARQWCAGV